MWIVEPGSWRFLAVNRQAVARYGYSPEEFLSLSLADIRPPEDVPAFHAAVSRLGERPQAAGGDAGIWRHRNKAGEDLLAHVHWRSARFEGRLCVLILASDVTERERLAAALGESRRLFESAFECGAMGSALVGLDGRFERANEALCRMLGREPGGLAGLTFSEVTHPDDLAQSRAAHERLLSGRAEDVSLEKRYLRPDGRVVWAAVTISLLRGTSEEPRCFVTQVLDITERKLVEEALRESEERFRQIAENISEVFYIAELHNAGVVYVSPAYEQVWGRGREALYARAERWTDFIHPEDREAAMANAGRGAPEFEYRIVRPDGEVRIIQARNFPIRDESGRVRRLVGVARDVTEHKRQEEALLQTQAQLLHAVKMEAVGRLAGGVAHDFNNILTAIIGLSDLALQRAPEGDPSRGDLLEIKAAGKRAAQLTQQLLAFSRKQVIRPKVLDLGGLLRDVQKMLRRIIGEDIALEMDPQTEPCLVNMDPGQMEQLVVNLAVNARDAMPEGGRLEFQARVLELDKAFVASRQGSRAGPHVMLRVTDTGTGIEEEALKHIFEPFFTTKAPGKGTGLGLATCYGIVKQNGGYI